MGVEFLWLTALTSAAASLVLLVGGLTAYKLSAERGMVPDHPLPRILLVLVVLAFTFYVNPPVRWTADNSSVNVEHDEVTFDRHEAVEPTRTTRNFRSDHADEMALHRKRLSEQRELSDEQLRRIKETQ